MLHYSLGFLL